LLNYTIRRVLIGILTLWGISLLVFCLIRMMPGDPAAMQTEVQDPNASVALYELMRKQFHLDKPVHEQYLLWFGGAITGDFGTSFQPHGLPVSRLIRERLMPTVSVSALSILLGLAAAIPLGLLQAVGHRRWFDRVSGTALYALYAIPPYVTAVVLIYFVGVQWDLLPFRGMTSDGFDEMSFAGKAKDLAAHFILITFCYTYPAVAFDTRFVRGNLLEVLRQDFVRTARAKGLPERTVVLKHAFRNTFIPLLTRLGAMIPHLVSGSVILEFIFNWQGLGQLFLEGIAARDYPLIMAMLLISSVLVQVGILLSDLAYAWADPRISYA
jgi:peptide/nickel transport system permease protein